MFIKIKNFLFKTNYRFVFSAFLLTNLFLLLRVVGTDPKIIVLFLLIIVFIIYLKIKDIVASSFLVSVYTFQFYAPNKYYLVEVLKAYETILEKGGYVLGYGVNLENIFLLITAVFIIRRIYLNKEYKRKVKFWTIIPVTLFAIFFLAIGIYSAIIRSPHLILSTVWLMQFMQMYLVAFIMIYIFSKSKTIFELIYPVISASLIFQGIVGILQFINQSWTGLPVESYRYSSMYYGATDAVDNLFRIPGTFAHPNQLGLLVIVMMVVLIPQAIKHKNIVYSISLVMGLLVVLLTQSRASWISLIPVTVLICFSYRAKLREIINSIGVRKVFIVFSLIAIATAAVIIPRTLRSLNAFSAGAGIPLRVEMAKEAGFGIALSPWIGYGAGTNEFILYSLFPEGYNYSFPAPVHIAYLQFILEFGILGLACFISPFIYLLRNILNKKGRFNKSKEFITIYLTGILAFTFYYLFQPHEGIREFAYLGIILGYGMISSYLLRLKKNEK